MLNKPKIKTAVPKRRYQLGIFSIVVLGDIQSEDGRRYHHVLAAVREGDAEPGLYLTAEPSPPELAARGAVCMRIIMADGEDVLGADDEWIDVDAFAEEGLTLVKTLLQLSDEEAFRLL